MLVQAGGVVTGVVAQSVLGSHATATAVSPMHGDVVLWQTMVVPQSASFWQGAGRQVVEGAGASVMQVVPGVQASVGGGMDVSTWQVRPWAQSPLSAQGCALANSGLARAVARVAMPKS